MTDFGGFLGLAEHVKLGIYAKNAVKVQEHIVKKLMRDNKNTVYGKAPISRTFTPLRTIRQRFLSRATRTTRNISTAWLKPAKEIL